jgi:hypothetical protein
MKLITLLTLAISLIVTNGIAQTGPERLTITLSGGLIQQHPTPVVIEFSATGNDLFNLNDTTTGLGTNGAVANSQSSAATTVTPDSSAQVVLGPLNTYQDSISVSIGNLTNAVFPFTTSSDNVIIDRFDSRPLLDRYTVYNFGIASDHADTITINASSFIDSVSANISNNKQISFVYLEDLTTGLFYSLMNQNVALAIPVDTNSATNYKLHVMVRSTINATGATCINPNGSVFMENTNCTNWNYRIYLNGTPVASDAVFSQDTTVTNIAPGNYAVAIYTNNLLADSSSITVQAAIQIVSHFTADNYSVFENDVISFTNSSAGAVLYNWSFDDSTTDSLENPTHSFATAGNYAVTLTAINQYGCLSTFTDTVYVSALSPVHQAPSFLQLLDENQASKNEAAVRHAKEATVFANGKNITVALNTEEQNINVEIMNMNGQLISSDSVMDASTVFQVAEAGIYIVKIAYANGEVVSKKILVNN